MDGKNGNGELILEELSEKHNGSEFYKRLSNYYDEIFKVSEEQLKFTMKYFKDSNKLLDIGCSTGLLASMLIEKKFDITGVDLDENMIKIAESKNSEGKFYPLNMLNLIDKFSTSSFDGAYCYGNTIVHLDSVEEISYFLLQVKNVIKKGSLFILQLLDYDNIFNNNIKELPVIKTKSCVFERFYEYNAPYDKINFKIKLTLHSESSSFTESLTLLPISKAKLKKLLKKCGFSVEAIFGGFDMQSPGSSSLPLVVVARSV